MDYDLVGLGTIMVKSDTLKLNNSVTAHKDGDRDSSSLGACVATFHNTGEKEGPLPVLAEVPLCYCGKRTEIVGLGLQTTEVNPR
jgi:hypothetical protein